MDIDIDIDNDNGFSFLINMVPSVASLMVDHCRHR